VAEIAALPEQKALRERWLKHNALEPGKPMVLCFPEGSWGELLPDSSLQCEDKTCRGWEWQLRSIIYTHDVLQDDSTVDPWFNIGWQYEAGDFGIAIEYHHGDNRGSYVWDPPLKELNEGDFSRLRFRTPKVDRDKTHDLMNEAARAFGDLLPARIRGGVIWSLGMTQDIIKLIGLENLMVYMYTKPDEIKRLMAWFRDEHLNFMHWFEREGLLTYNNETDYVGSGGFGHTTVLPRKGADLHGPAKIADLWGFAESQETVGISPEMFAEFILPYQMPLLELFGLTCYGCCEPMHDRVDYMKDLASLRRVSVAPTANQALLAQKLRGRAIFSRKPNPSQVCVMFDEGAIHNDIQETLSTAHGNTIEIIMKDTHTVENHPERLSRWVALAKKEVENFNQ
jgi:hypothetical protein